MKKNIFFITIFILLCHTVFSQETEKIIQDIERKILQENNEEHLSELYEQLAHKYGSLNNYNKAIENYSNAMEISMKNKEYDKIASFYIHIGRNYYLDNQISESLENYQKVFIYEDKIKDSILAEAKQNMGIIYYNLSEFDKSLKYFESAYKIYSNRQDTINEATVIANIAVIYSLKGDIAKSIEYFNKVLNIFEDKKDTKSLLQIYSNMGVIYRKINSYDKSLEFYNKARHLLKDSKDSSGYKDLYLNIGGVYKAMELNDSAKYYFEKSYFLCLSLNDREREAGALNNLGTIYEAEKDYDKALDYYNKSLKIKQELGTKLSYISTYINIGKIYVEKNNFISAEKYLLTALLYADSLAVIDLQILANQSLYQLYDKKQDYQNALKYYKIFSDQQDTLLNRDKLEQINRLNIVYQTEQKNKENEILKSENQYNRQKMRIIYYLAGGLIIISIISVLLIISFYKQQKLKQANQTFILEQKLLRSQMNPHFIFNSLIAIQSYMFENDTMQAAQYLSDFAKLMRLILENSTEELIPITKERETMKYYLKLQQLRFENKFDYEIIIDKKIESDMVKIPPMLVQPLIENAIEHGMRMQKNKGLLKIMFTAKNEFIEICVIDNGIGMAKAKEISNMHEQKHKSFALKILNERLKNYTANETAKLNIQSNAEGTQVSFLIPIKYNKYD